MDELAPESAGPTQEPRELVRRFDSRRHVKRARRHGIPFDKTKGTGIPATTIDIEPIDPDRIKDVTGARNADAWMDIDITDKKVLRRLTKSGRKEIVIVEDILAREVIDAGRTSGHGARLDDDLA